MAEVEGRVRLVLPREFSELLARPAFQRRGTDTAPETIESTKFVGTPQCNSAFPWRARLATRNEVIKYLVRFYVEQIFSYFLQTSAIFALIVQASALLNRFLREAGEQYENDHRCPDSRRDMFDRQRACERAVDRSRCRRG